MKKKSNRGLWTKVLSSVAVSGVILSGLVFGGVNLSTGSLVTDASAGVSGGGSGGGGGGGGGYGSARWMQLSKTKVTNGTISNIPAEINSAVCQDAEAYWALVPNVVSSGNATSDRWTYSLFGVTNLQGASFSGGAGLAQTIASNVGWSYQQASDYMFQKNFICLDNPNTVTTNEWRYEVRDNGSSTDSLSQNGVHTLTTQVAPQPINAGTAAAPVMKTDPIGKVNLHAQSTALETNYGKVWDAYKAAVDASGSNAKNIVAQFKTKFADAIAKDKAAGRASISLDAANQEGLGEGGILNVSEYSKTAKASASTTSRNYQVWRCGWDHWSKSGWQATGCQSVSGTIDPNNLPKAGKDAAKWVSAAEKAQYTPVSAGQTSWTKFATTVQPSTQTQKQTGFWQILAAHCNPQGIVNLKNALGTALTPMDSGDSSSEVSALLRTKFYAQQPSVLPLGDPNATNAAQKATSTLGFFDKECPLDCTPNRAASAGATSANGAISNVSQDNFAKTTKGLFGSKTSDNVNSNYTEMFRDNTERTIRPDVWYPVASASKGVAYSGGAAKSTLITRWAGGTPTLGTEFNAYAGTGDKKTAIFNPSSTAQTDQVNFETAGKNYNFSSSTAAQLAGRLDKITVQSTWASTLGKPQALQVAWEYSVASTSKVPNGISFAAGGTNAQIGSFVNRTTAIDGRCWGEYGTTSQTTKTLASSDLNSSTGTGASTNFTVPNGSETTKRNLVLNFVRGTSE